MPAHSASQSSAPARPGGHGGKNDPANYALRLQASIKAEAERLAKAEGTTLNQFINVAVAEKIAALRTADYFRERARRANLSGALALLDRLGRDDPPQSGDELV